MTVAPEQAIMIRGQPWTVLRVSSVEPAVYAKEGHPPKWGGRTNWFYTDEVDPSDSEHTSSHEELKVTALAKIPGGVTAEVGRQPFDPDSHVMFHVAPERLRESILRHGLDWTKGPRGTDYAALQSEPGNYIWPLEDQAMRDIERQHENGIPSDFYEVDVTGLPLEADPVWPEAMRCVEPIPPERVRHIELT